MGHLKEPLAGPRIQAGDSVLLSRNSSHKSAVSQPSFATRKPLRIQGMRLSRGTLNFCDTRASATLWWLPDPKWPLVTRLLTLVANSQEISISTRLGSMGKNAKRVSAVITVATEFATCVTVGSSARLRFQNRREGDSVSGILERKGYSGQAARASEERTMTRSLGGEAE
jgi:hypothetical protein